MHCLYMLNQVDILLRGIQAAQDALAATGTLPMMDGAADTPARSTSVQATPSKRKKTVRTYESSSKRSKTVAHDNGLRGNPEEQHQNSSRKAEWLTSTLKPDFAAHEPNMMFSETSSTIPDNTMTQQRIIQEAIETSRPGETISTQNKSDHTQNSDSSIPWSAYKDTLKAAPLPSHAGQRDATPAPYSQPVSSLNRRSQTHVPSRLSQTPLHGSHDEDATVEQLSPIKAPVSSSRTRRTKTSVSPIQPDIPKPVSLLSEIQVQDVSLERMAEAMPDSRENSKPKRQKTRSVSPKKSEPTSDELWIGVSKEQYKPRASRSRSARVTDDEYLQAVHSTLKPKSKRRKTTYEKLEHPEKPIQATDSGTSVPPTIPELPETNSKAVREHTNAKPDEELDGNEDVANRNKENEAPGTKSPPSSARRSGPQSRPVLVEVSIPPPAPSSSIRKSSAIPENLVVKSGSVEIATLKPTPQPPASKGRKKAEAQRSKTAVTPGFSQRRKIFDSDDSDSDISPAKSFSSEKDELGIAPAIKAQAKAKVVEMPPPPSPIKVAEKKKGRGRPSKTDKVLTNTVPATSMPNEVHRHAADEDPEETETPMLDEPMRMDNDHDDSVETSTTTKRLALEIAEQLKKTNKPAPPASTPEQTFAPTESLQKTPEVRKKGKGAMSHSPINKGKVGYRVGLSRSTRIAPLLKIMRK